MTITLVNRPCEIMAFTLPMRKSSFSIATIEKIVLPMISHWNIQSNIVKTRKREKIRFYECKSEMNVNSK